MTSVEGAGLRNRGGGRGGGGDDGAAAGGDGAGVLSHSDTTNDSREGPSSTSARQGEEAAEDSNEDFWVALSLFALLTLGLSLVLAALYMYSNLNAPGSGYDDPHGGRKVQAMELHYNLGLEELYNGGEQRVCLFLLSYLCVSVEVSDSFKLFFL